LIEERGFESITVGEISTRAQISRATFYRLYQDKYDLVEQIFAEATRTLFEAVLEPGSAHPPEIWVHFFEHIGQYNRLYRALLGRRGSPWFVLKMRTALVDLIKKHEQNPQLHPVNPTRDSRLNDYARDIVATLMVESIIWWLEQGMPYTPREMTNRCASLASAIFTATVNW